jgi:hypothetical protein
MKYSEIQMKVSKSFRKMYVDSIAGDLHDIYRLDLSESYLLRNVKHSQLFNINQWEM